jgi:mitogen-activated protein kinase kinase
MAVSIATNELASKAIDRYLQPERIKGGQYTIRSDVWSSGLTLMTLAQNRFPYPDDLIGIIELINYITKEDIPQLMDEDADHDGYAEVRWSDNMKHFISVWYVISMRRLFCYGA